MITDADIGGHWQREYIVAPGLEDRTTQVHWLQGNSVFADLRVPCDLPDISDAECLAELSNDDLLQLARCEGFAGYTTVGRGVCEWTRIINWRGPQRCADKGYLSWDDSGGLVEAGIDADYRELWHRTERGPFRARIHASETRRLFLVSSNNSFLLAIDDIAATVADSRKERIEAAAGDSLRLSEVFYAEYSLGYWDKHYEIVELSTNPLTAGRPVLDRRDLEASNFTLTRSDFYGGFRTEHWPLVEMVATVGSD